MYATDLLTFYSKKTEFAIILKYSSLFHLSEKATNEKVG